MSQLENIMYQASVFGPLDRILTGGNSRTSETARMLYQSRHGNSSVRGLHIDQPRHGTSDVDQPSPLIKRLRGFRSGIVRGALERLGLLKLDGQSGVHSGPEIHGSSTTVGEWWRRHRSRGELARLDDRNLRDIGANRSEAHFESGKWFWQA